MAFYPNSTIYLCNVPIDNTYQNQIYFPNATTQREYFSTRVNRTFANYLTVRKTLPDGSLQSSVKVEANIDDLYDCNYMYYQNANHGTRWFYAFITKLIYVNEGTTEIVFETDVYQTWMFDVSIKDSYVVREHSETDNIGGNIVPEKFSFQDYTYTEITDAFDDVDLSDFGYLVASSEFISVNDKVESETARYLSGIYQGLYFYYFLEGLGVRSFIQKVETDCVQFVAAIPKFCVEGAEGLLETTSKPAEKNIYFVNPLQGVTFDGYTPKNNKMYTSPFTQLVITNHSGDEVEYNLEDFSTTDSITFVMKGDISANPSITLYPYNYKNAVENPDFGISISGFPQCSTNTDSFKLWLAKNQYGVAIDTMANLGTIALGVAGMATGIGGAVGAGAIMHGVTGVLNTVNNVYKASKEPNRSKMGAPKNNLLTAMGKNTFQAYIRTIKADYARTIDSFFTMYGYQVNRVKTPNISSRPYFNYVQTVDVNIDGSIPNDDMRTLKTMFNNGVTFWKSSATVGDYSVDNSP